MKTLRLGRTELNVTRTGFGALPIQRRNKDDAAKILRAAYDGGINFFDTANAYSDSEEKIGVALSDVRHNIIIATKSMATDKKTVTEHIENSLKKMKTDYIDIFQFHNPAELPDINDHSGAFAAALEAKEKGYVRFIGITNHRLDVAKAAVESGNFDTVQFPMSYLASDDEIGLIHDCKKADVGFIAMKGLAGGLLTNVMLCRAFMNQFDNVVPIWGIQTMEQLHQWLEAEKAEPHMTDELKIIMEKEKRELGGSFCRSCGYCAPCPADIEIYTMARLDMLMSRSPYQPYLTDSFYAKAMKMKDCLNCGACKTRCPYGLDIPNILKYQLKHYEEFYQSHADEHSKA